MDNMRKEEIYKVSHQTLVTSEIRKLRLNWLGQMPEGASAKLAFKEHLKKGKGNSRR